MRFRKMLLAAFTIPLFLAGCGGGDNTNAYDGTWQAVYPPLSKDSTISDTKTVFCNNPGGTLIIKDSAGTATLSATCTTTITVAGTPPTTTTYPAVTTYATVGVNIVAKTGIDQKDVLNAVVNGVTFTGTCISTVTCSAASTAGDTLSLTR
jgi:hypothetical protein